jgi:RNA polymerase sigma-70 factor (ECF subfamily)
MERRPLGEEDRDMIRLLADEATAELLTGLPPDQRAAVVGHVVEERDYAELADDAHASEAAVRQRVSRGLSTLRRKMGARV